MLLAAVHIDTAVATRVLVNQDFSHPEKHYRLLSAQNVSSTDIEADLTRIYSDRRYAIRKQLFSQDGRPSKTVRSRPKFIVVTPTGCSTVVRNLREKRIPVEVVFLDGGKEWRRDDAGKGMGQDYHVSPDALQSILSRVIDEKRIECEETASPIPADVSSVSRAAHGFCYGEKALRQTLAAAIWFRETIRYSRSYRA
jgi:hypothetical protein